MEPVHDLHVDAEDRKCSEDLVKSRLCLPVFLAITAAAACSGAPSMVEPGNPLAMRSTDEPVVVETAEVPGILVLEGGCLALRLPPDLQPGTDVVTIVWPEGRTTWDADKQQVTMTRAGGQDDLVAVVGDSVELAGGYPLDSNIGGEWAVEPNSTCPPNYVVTG